MSNKTQYAKALTALVAFALFASGCTKKRDAALPEEAQESIFAIKETDALQAESADMQVTTDERLTNLSLGDASKATAEKGVVAVTDVKVPNRLKFMFKGLEMTGQAGRSYPITLSVDRQFVTAYKIVSDVSELSILEKQLAQVKEEVVLQKQLQKAKDNSKVKSLLANLKQVRAQKATALAKKDAKILVPLFKFKITGYGVLQRTKNQLNEETSTLRLKTTDWADATHFQMSINPSDRMPVGIDAASRGDLDRTFVMDRINNKVMTAKTLKEEFQIPVAMQENARVLTLLDVDALHVFEIGQIGKTELSDSQMQQLKLGSNKSNVRQCSAELVKTLPAEAQEGCILILRYDVPVSYVRAELPVVDYDGNQDATVSFKPVRAVENTGLVQIEQNVQPKKIEANNEMDPRTTLRVADIKGKEFFFKRTLEDAPETTIFPPGMAGALTIVKFDLEENRLVVRKADKLLNHKNGSNAMEYEELMSIPVKYFKHDKKDASGADYSMVRMAPATRVDAELIEIDWTRNTLSSDYSPYESLQESCIRSIADTQVSDVNMNLEKGSLNFTFNYSVGLAAWCISDYRVANDYNGTPNYSTTARMKERVSFKLNDGKSDKAFAPEVPFRAQNAMGYGVWTIGQINPTETGLYGREGQERNMTVVHDFRDGKTLLYTVTGLEPSAKLQPEIRQLFIDTTKEVVDAWDLAYRQAFKGTPFERTGRYVEVQFAGQDGIEAKVGDLNRNIIHFENKFNDNHGVLGVSQVGYNPRSGIVVADSLIVYAGNLQQYIAGTQRNQQITVAWNDQKEAFRQAALKQLTQQQEAEAAAEKQAAAGAKAGGTTEEKVQTATQFAKKIAKLALAHKKEVGTKVQTKNISAVTSNVKAAAQLRKSLGGDSAFQYASPNMESGWLDRVLRKLNENKSMDVAELEGLVAKEMLASKGAKLNQRDRNQLEAMTRRGDIRTKLSSHFKNSPGCMLTARESLGRKYAQSSYKDALREMLYFDLAHEMGHSQGLTHNFIGSFDKANFNNMDGSESKRNYSSIMDYYAPGSFSWDGIGKYDIHALRASHTGLLESSQAGKYVHVDQIKNAMKSWNNVTTNAVSKYLKPYKYCTDIHVQLEPTCQRFDSGTSATEIVENLIKDYDDGYVTNYHSWGRNNFYLGSSAAATGRSMHTMFLMRQFMDELFYKLVLGIGSQEERQDYMQATLKAYIFFNQLLKTPDANSPFLSADRFEAIPYQYKETNEKGEETGKVITDIEIVEKRALQDMAMAEDRLDTVGIEYDKLMAMNFLTMKGYPEYKYYANSIQFSFLDFEKYILGMSPESSIYVNTITGMLLDQLQPSFTNAHAILSLAEGLKATVTPAMRAYAGIFSVLNLEASTLRDKDNFANLFKVGTSVGAAPTDRITLSQLGVSADSKTRLTYWAVDNALASGTLLQVAAEKNNVLQASDVIVPMIEKMVALQTQDLLTQGKMAEQVKAAKEALTAKLNELNKDGKLVSAELVKANPQLSVEGQVAMMEELNKQIISVSIALLTEQKGAQEAAQQLADQASQIEEVLPLFSLNFTAVKSGLEKTGAALSKNKGFEVLEQLGDVVGQLVNGSNLEVSYGIIMKNLEFLNKLSLMTNPELNRQ
nr:hypothetical protein HAGR004_32870 [Bdellovibrio sp. HAGR004]